MEARTNIAESRVSISRAALMHNVRLLRRSIAPGVRLCAVVKADAYGHGAATVVDTLCNFTSEDTESPAVDYLAVATIDEAAQLPDSVLPVLILRPVENTFAGRNRDAIEHAIQNGWILLISSPAAVDDVARLAIKIGRRASVHVMVDTGLTRTGTSLENLFTLLTRIESRGSALRLLAIGTHFANSEIAHDPFTKEQLARFHAATDGFIGATPRKILRHACNSGGVFFAGAEAQFDMIRPGVALYGIDPTLRPNLDRPLRPVLKWTAPLVAIHDIRASATVGYGQSWIAARDTRIGVVPVGYADGYLRSLSNRGVMMLGKFGVPVVGRVSMDYTCIDLHDVPHARIGDEVTILDNDPLSPASAYEIARRGETIPYELFTRIGPRIKRFAVDPEESLATESLMMEE
jgi:alanine racemase